jgi:beta-lactam-binding protein with PASTA domain
VSTGPAVNVKVPGVTGQSVQAAQASLNAQKLKYTYVTVAQWSSPVIPGTVLAQSPLAGTQVTQNTTIKLTVLGAGGQYPLPDVTGESPVAAGNQLGQYGLNVGTESNACSSGVASGLVASTSPTANQYVTQGTFVNLVISTGPCPVAVPNVIGLTAQQAMTQISNAQLSPVIQNCATGPSSATIVSQSPVFGTMLQPGQTVTATLGCAGTTTTSMP